MSEPCAADFVRLGNRLGGISCDAHPIVTLRAPWALENWTLPVVELLMIAGAVCGLAHAITKLRRGQPAWLGLWVATVMYVLLLEPPLYFPEAFGLEDRVGLIFVHNVFSVEFLYDRLPLYIVALYPATIYLSHALVERIGVFRRHGIIVGGITVGALHHAFYEIFDHVGPQLRWWAWNPGLDTNKPFFASVPLNSAVLFATVSPAVLVMLARRFLFDDGAADRAHRSWMLRSAGIGSLVVVLQPLLGAPVTASAVTLWATVVVAVGIGLYAVATTGPQDASGDGSWLPVLFAAAYLMVFAVLWATALPELLDATARRTVDGDPVGNPTYVLGCAAVATGMVLRAARRTPSRLAP